LKLTAVRAGLLIASILLIAAIVDALAERHPLSDAHWDAAIYLFRARAFVEGDVLGSFREAAAGIHDAVMRGVYPTPYWSFMRLGQTVLIGAVAGVVGTTEESIHVVTWLFRGLLVIGLLVSAMLAATLARVARNGAPETGWIHTGAILSVALYVLSDVASYMSGNLVSEVPAIALIAVSAWCLVRSWETGSTFLAAMSGCAAFALYVVRMESIWSYASLLVALGWLLAGQGADGRSGWRSLLISACTAGALFAAYSWFFFPLTDPRLAVRFSEATAKFAAAASPQMVEGTNMRSLQQLIAANGLLWVGALLGVGRIRTDRAFQFAAVWFIASLVPVAVALTHATDTQTRVYTILTPTLLVLSTLGWAHFLQAHDGFRWTVTAAGLALACGLLVGISQPASYGILRDLPGLWRLQYVRQYLAPVPYERIDYVLPELVTMAASIGRLPGETALMASPRMQGADHIMVVQYLMKAKRSDRASAAGSNALVTAGQTAGTSVRVHLSVTPEEDVRLLTSQKDGTRVLLLAMSTEGDWARQFECCGRILAISKTPGFTLYEFRRIPD
jgi:hypothetical protein